MIKELNLNSLSMLAFYIMFAFLDIQQLLYIINCSVHNSLQYGNVLKTSELEEPPCLNLFNSILFH